MGIDEHLQELKEKEIIRLTTPVTRKKINGKPDEIYDCEGNLVANTNNTNYVLEPNNQILSNEEALEILKKEAGIKWDPDIVDVLVEIKTEPKEENV